MYVCMCVCIWVRESECVFSGMYECVQFQYSRSVDVLKDESLAAARGAVG